MFFILARKENKIEHQLLRLVGKTGQIEPGILGSAITIYCIVDILGRSRWLTRIQNKTIKR